MPGQSVWGGVELLPSHTLLRGGGASPQDHTLSGKGTFLFPLKVMMQSNSAPFPSSVLVGKRQGGVVYVSLSDFIGSTMPLIIKQLEQSEIKLSFLIICGFEKLPGS